jgi:hypothetical protein
MQTPCRRPSRVRLVVLAGLWVAGLAGLGTAVQAQAGKPATAPAFPLDFTTFRAKVEPVFLKKRPEHARCVVCHSQGTNFRLQELSPGATGWTEAQSRKNFEQVQRLVVPGNPAASRLLLMPLAEEVGGIHFHPGGKHFMSLNDPEWKGMADWVKATR